MRALLMILATAGLSAAAQPAELTDLDLAGKLLVAVAQDQQVGLEFKKLLAMGDTMTEVTLQSNPDARDVSIDTYTVITRNCDMHGDCSGGGTLTVQVMSSEMVPGNKVVVYSVVLKAN